RVQLLPEGVDPFAAGTNMIWWVHRTGRGWSRAAASVDVRTGEILHANVRLGSQRVHQLTALFETLLSPYGRADEAQRLAQIEQAVITRIKHLAAHEIGHALGFVHNYASTTHQVPSVMDYPHPRLGTTVTDDGITQINLDDAYTPSLGEWDFELVRRAYAAEEDAQPPQIALPFISDMDGHGADASVPEGVPWTFGADPLKSLTTVLAVRRLALAEFGEGTLKPGRQLGEVEGRFYLAYLLHRHQAAAVARLVGGASYRYGLVGQAQAGTTPVDAPRQRDALAQLVALLDPKILAVPRLALRSLTPPSLRFARSADAAIPTAGPLFDTARAAEIAAGTVLEHCFTAGRLNRLWDQRSAGLDVPTITELVGAVAKAVFDPIGDDPTVTAGAAWAFARHVVAAAENPTLHPWVRAELLSQLGAVCLLAAAATQTPASSAASALLKYCETGQRGMIGEPTAPPLGIPL
ncbi:MAG TPA: zinc-dependent metalloprotease, partial [Glaciihabitans sp.]|nr:zinc-dependent metalloprotease [Glaciihabitans sp.]